MAGQIAARMIDLGYDAFADPYCYKNSFVLKNRAGLRDPAALEAFELEMTTLRAEEPLPAGRFGPAHYRAVHRHIFQDVYRWAGRYRTVRTSKGGNPFCFPEHIPGQMNALFAALHQRGGLDPPNAENFVSIAADFLAELNAIHPLREGNGRAQLAFTHLLGLRAGHPFDFARVRPETFLPAMIASYGGELEPLRGELTELLV
jgi:cell filamentation protein